MSELEDFAAAQEKDWSQFVAVAPIFHGAARAYNPGDSVPASNVALHGYDKQGLVARRDTKAAKAVTETPEG